MDELNGSRLGMEGVGTKEAWREGKQETESPGAKARPAVVQCGLETRPRPREVKTVFLVMMRDTACLSRLRPYMEGANWP